MDFEERLDRAIVRGQQTRNAKDRTVAEQAISEEDQKNTHSKCRIDLSDHIEACLKQLADRFPGFQFSSIVGEDGWGAKVSRDDFRKGTSRDGRNQYSRFEMVIRPYSTAHIVELAAKATVRNKEIFNRTHYQFLSQVDVDSFSELIDLWSLEYAERYTAQS